MSGVIKEVAVQQPTFESQQYSGWSKDRKLVGEIEYIRRSPNVGVEISFRLFRLCLR